MPAHGKPAMRETGGVIAPESQPDLFGVPAPAPALPAGMRYEPDFLSAAEEHDLLRRIETLALAPMQYQGYTALRRVLSYGSSYDFSRQRLEAADALPDWLDTLRTRAGAWAGIAPEAFTQALVAEYRPGTPLGWHRDVPDFEDVVGLSLLADATMRFRPYPPREPKRADVLKLVVAPRSVYLLRGPARWEWQHSVSPTRALRYSITLRTASDRRTTRSRAP